MIENSTPIKIIRDIKDLAGNRELYRIELTNIQQPYAAFSHTGDYKIYNQSFALITAGNNIRPIAPAYLFKNGQFEYGSISELMFMDIPSVLATLESYYTAQITALRSERGIFDDSKWLQKLLKDTDIRILI